MALIAQSFKKLFSRSLVINSTIKEKSLKKMVDSKRMLFKLMKEIGVIYSWKTEEAQLKRNKGNQSKFFKQFVQLKSRFDKRNKLLQMINGSSMERLFFALKSMRKQREFEMKLRIGIFGSLYLKRGREAVSEKRETCDKKDVLGLSIKEHLRVISFHFFTKTLKKLKNLREKIVVK